MATIYIDDRPYPANPRTNLLQAALSLGFDLPYFCWHPALGSVGACRQCAVKQFRDEKDKHGQIVMACMVPAADGVRLSIDDPEAREFRASVIEWLMTNHPHDCPVCDEGGECHLQDVTVMTGHTRRRYRFEKRTYRNQDLGPFINHEMNRCIQCYRCVRFYRDYAGGTDLNAFAAHNHVYFGRDRDGVLESEFSGNLVEVCPTGVFTDKTLKPHFARKWDLSSTPSVCTHCSLGCNILAGERYGRLRRILNRYHHEVNGYFICDRGRFGYDFVNHPRRLRRPRVRDASGSSVEASGDDAVSRANQALSNPERVIGIGSPRASLESNFALRRLVGAERFYSGCSAREFDLTARCLTQLRSGPFRSPSMREIAESDAVLVLGEDISGTAPRLALAVRQSVRQHAFEAAQGLKIPVWHDRAVRDLVQDAHGPLFVAGYSPTRLDDITTRRVCAGPAALVHLAATIAHSIDPKAPAAPGGLPDESRQFVKDAVDAVANARRPLIVSGTGAGSAGLIDAAANIARALCRTGKAAALSLVFPEANSLGLAMLGGRSLQDALEAIESGSVDTVIVLENDLHRRAAPEAITRALGKARTRIALDSFANPTTELADIVLPAGTFAESDGTFVNNEGRAQRFYNALPPDAVIQESWRWIGRLACGDAKPANWVKFDAVVAALVYDFPELAAVADAAPNATFRLASQKLARASRRFSGRTAILANVAVSEPKPPEDPDSPFTFTMEGHPSSNQSPLVSQFWAPGWNSGNALNKFQSEIAGPLVGGDSGRRLIEPGTNGDTNGAYASVGIEPGGDTPAGGMIAAPRHHVFGSEELSSLAPAIEERSTALYLELNVKEAERLSLAEGSLARTTIGGREFVFPVTIDKSLPDGLFTVPVGLPGLEGLELPADAALKGEP